MSSSYRPKLAGVVTTYFKYSHAQHIVDRFLDGYGWNGAHHYPPMDLVSLYVDQVGQIFFKTVQNKLHWAITGKTAAELIAERAQAGKPNMGLKTWKNAPRGRIQKADVAVAKNYLEEGEIKALERIVSMYLDYAENQASRQIPMRMADWIEKLDAFLKFNEYDVLANAGRVSHEVAKELAEKQFEAFNVVQDRSFESDFERASKKILGQKRIATKKQKIKR